jgi:hypothetical protein
MYLNEVMETVIAAAIAVHRVPGPGLLESTYTDSRASASHLAETIGLPIGMAMNFSATELRCGICRLVNNVKQ